MAHHPFPWRDAFLAALREMPVVQHACDTVGIERCTAYRARKADKDLAEAWDEAMEAGIDRAEQEAFRRGVQGWSEPVVSQGRLAMETLLDAEGQPILDPNTGKPKLRVLTVRKHSDALLALVLKGRRKKVYAERTELTGADGGPVAMDQTTRAARVAALLEAARSRRDAEDEFA